MNVFDGYHDWTSPITDIEKMKVIITDRYWNKSFNHDNLTSEIDQIIKNLNLTSILDYGAGLGRNLPLLRKYAPIVDYLDLETYKPHTLELNYDNKFYIQMEPLPLSKKYDLIYASVVIQHVVNKDLLRKIIEFMQKKQQICFFCSKFNNKFSRFY
jgi:SAM-dependent methyltransferase